MSNSELIDELYRPVEDLDRMVEREALRRILAHVKEIPFQVLPMEEVEQKK